MISMRADDPLAELKVIHPRDLKDKPLIIPSRHFPKVQDWMREVFYPETIVMTTHLIQKVQ